MEYTEQQVTLQKHVDPLTLLGYNDTNVLLLENRFNVTISLQDNNLHIKGEGDNVELAIQVLQELQRIISRTGSLSTNDVVTVIDILESDRRLNQSHPVDQKSERQSVGTILYTGPKKTIKARNTAQITYADKVLHNDVVFAIGPAGTGKTYLAVAFALDALQRGRVQRIILTRPAVEAGESLGFLPGDLHEKIDPYLRPLLDSLLDMLSGERLKNMLENRTVEIIPLAYMRGRTLNNAFIILDEAQNTTVGQMKMFLTRLGENSKAIITGDITQIDLRSNTPSGLVEVEKILKGIEGIDFMYFDKSHVVRHALVAKIIEAYEQQGL